MASRRATRESKSPELRIPLADRREARALIFLSFVVWATLVPLPLLWFAVTRSPYAIAALLTFIALASAITFIMRIDHNRRKLCELVLEKKGVRLVRAGRDRWKLRWSEVLGWRGTEQDRREGKIAIITRDGRRFTVPVEGSLQIDGRYDRVAATIGEFCREIRTDSTAELTQ
jgi:hypothetical protein